MSSVTLPRRRSPRAHAKGEHTRALILDSALHLATRSGLSRLSLSGIAEQTGMSKSGVFAHFGSYDELLIAVIREYHRRFEQEIFRPALAQPRGLPRLRALFDLWLVRVAREIDAGCLYISGAVEFDERPGPVRDALVGLVRAWQQALSQAIAQAVSEGHLDAATQPEQLLFELHALVLAAHHRARFLGDPDTMNLARLGFARVVQRSLTTPGSDANALPIHHQLFIQGDPSWP